MAVAARYLFVGGAGFVPGVPQEGEIVSADFAPHVQQQIATSPSYRPVLVAAKPRHRPAKKDAPTQAVVAAIAGQAAQVANVADGMAGATGQE